MDFYFAANSRPFTDDNTNDRDDREYGHLELHWGVVIGDVENAS